MAGVCSGHSPARTGFCDNVGILRSAEYSFTISASQPWTDTGVDLAAGATLSFTAEAKPGADASCLPQGAVSASTSDKLLLPPGR